MMDNIWLTSALWIGLALASSLISIRLALSVALIEIMMGALGGNIIGMPLTPWINYLAGFGAILLTFLAGAEVDMAVVRRNLGASVGIGFVSFLLPYLGCMLAARYLLGWPWPQAQIAGIALSTTSVAVVYAVMVETGLNKTELGKIILAACFITDLGTVLALGIVFASFTIWLIAFAAATIVVAAVLPKVGPWFFKWVGRRVSEPEIKFLLLILFALGGFATAVGSEAVLPAYLIGMALGARFPARPRAAAPHAGHRLRGAHPVLFPESRLADRSQGARRRRGLDRALPRAEDGDQVHRHLAADALLSLRQTRGHVHHAADVDRADVRLDLGALRPDQSHHRPGAVHHPAHGGDRQRGGAHGDRAEMVPAEDRDRDEGHSAAPHPPTVMVAGATFGCLA